MSRIVSLRWLSHTKWKPKSSQRSACYPWSEPSSLPSSPASPRLLYVTALPTAPTSQACFCLRTLYLLRPQACTLPSSLWWPQLFLQPLLPWTMLERSFLITCRLLLPCICYFSLHISPSDVFVCCLLIHTILRGQGFCAFCSYYILNTYHSMCHMAGVQWIFVQQNK